MWETTDLIKPKRDLRVPGSAELVDLVEAGDGDGSDGRALELLEEDDRLGGSEGGDVRRRKGRQLGGV